MVDIIGQDNRFETNCTNCGAKLRFQSKDVRVGEELRGYSEFDRYYKTVILCPRCERPVDVTNTYGPSSEEAYAQQQREDNY